MKAGLLFIFLSLFGGTEISAQLLDNTPLGSGQRKYLPEEFHFILTGTLQEALDSLERKVGAGSLELGYYRACCLFAHGNIPAAFVEAERYSKIRGSANEYGGKMLMAQLHTIRFAPALARKALDEAIAINPGRLDAYLEVVRIEANRSDVQLGLSFVRNATKQFPDNIELLLYRGIFLARSGDVEDGFSDIARALSSESLNESEFWLATLWASRCSLELKRYQEALKYTTQCIDAGHFLGTAHGLRGETYYKMGAIDEALSDFQTMEQHGFTVVRYSEIIASLYEQKGDIATACAYYENLSAMNPGNRAYSSKKKKLCKKETKK